MSNQVTPETKKVSTVLEKSTRALVAGQTAIGKVIVDLEAGVAALVAQQQSLAQDIEFKGRELAEVTANTEAAVRDAKIELDFRVRENEDKVRIDLVKKAGLVTTTQAALTELEEDAAVANARANQAEFEAVKRAEQALHAKYGSEIANLKADQKVELAELNAQAKSDATTIALLKGQIASLEETIKANREADVQKAEAASKAAGVVVNAVK